ncbi:MAG: sigma-70 family RNA polymerase sigma factor [Planctomycetales bacterium]|nr:sigma-70 family RNA polymerase sigma factor [Planctomycetales bacterium]
MAEVTRILEQIEHGDHQAASELLPLVYDELRQLATHRMGQETTAQTLQPTALVHEAYLRLVGADDKPQWDSRGHFFAAAAIAMRRILIENARRKASVKHGGQHVRNELGDVADQIAPTDYGTLLALDDALTKLAAEDSHLARLIELRYFAGLTIDQAAESLGISSRTAKRNWAYGRAWLRRELDDE